MIEFVNMGKEKEGKVVTGRKKERMNEMVTGRMNE